LRLAVLLMIAMTTHAQTPLKTAPPPPAPPRPYEFPRAARRTLANGLRVAVIEDHRLPLVAASMQILAGHAYAPPEKAGLATLTAALLREGTKTRSAQEIARAVDSTGGRLEATAGNDVATVSMTFVKSHAALGFELMADIVCNPAFAEEEIERQVRQVQSGLAVQYASAQYLAGGRRRRAPFSGRIPTRGPAMARRKLSPPCAGTTSRNSTGNTTRRTAPGWSSPAISPPGKASRWPKSGSAAGRSRDRPTSPCRPRPSRSRTCW
jgi:zinc protease